LLQKHIYTKRAGQVGIALLYSKLQVGHGNGWCQILIQ